MKKNYVQFVHNPGLITLPGSHTLSIDPGKGLVNRSALIKKNKIVDFNSYCGQKLQIKGSISSNGSHF